MIDQLRIIAVAMIVLGFAVVGFIDLFHTGDYRLAAISGLLAIVNYLVVQ